MKNAMKLVAGLLLSTGLLAACGDDTNNFGGFGGNGGNGGEGTGATNNGGSGGGTGGEGGGGGTPIVIPPKPELGAQIDRMGRPAVNTALNGAFVQFNTGGVKVASDDDARKALENDYNADDNQNNWVTNYRNIFAANLAIIDALDTGLDIGGGPLTNAQACTNGAGNSGNLGSANAYDVIAGALADDRLWMKVDGELCSSSEPDVAQGYLALEIGLLTQTDPTGCGGRRPVDDVIETTYSATAIGAPIGFDDGVDAPAGLHPETFPYLADPH